MPRIKIGGAPWAIHFTLTQREIAEQDPVAFPVRGSPAGVEAVTGKRKGKI